MYTYGSAILGLAMGLALLPAAAAAHSDEKHDEAQSLALPFGRGIGESEARDYDRAGQEETRSGVRCAGGEPL